MPVVRCANSPSTNHRLCTPRESGPDVSKNETELVETLRRRDLLEVGDVECPHAGPLAAGLRARIGHTGHVARQSERVATCDPRRRGRQLIHEHWTLRLRDVDHADTTL